MKKLATGGRVFDVAETREEINENTELVDAKLLKEGMLPAATVADANKAVVVDAQGKYGLALPAGGTKLYKHILKGGTEDAAHYAEVITTSSTQLVGQKFKDIVNNADLVICMSWDANIMSSQGHIYLSKVDVYGTPSLVSYNISDAEYDLGVNPGDSVVATTDTVTEL